MTSGPASSRRSSTGCSRGSRWRVVAASPKERPCPSRAGRVPAIFEHPRLDASSSRNYRGLPSGSHARTVRSMVPIAAGYATIHLHKLEPSDASGRSPPRCAQHDLDDRGAGSTSARMLVRRRDRRRVRAPRSGQRRAALLATLAHLHRYGTRTEVIIQQRPPLRGRRAPLTSRCSSWLRYRTPPRNDGCSPTSGRGSHPGMASWGPPGSLRRAAARDRERRRQAWAASGASARRLSGARHRSCARRWTSPGRRALLGRVRDKDAWRSCSIRRCAADVRPRRRVRGRRRSGEAPAAPFAGAIAELDAPRRVSVRWYTDGAVPRSRQPDLRARADRDRDARRPPAPRLGSSRIRDGQPAPRARRGARGAPSLRGGVAPTTLAA